MRLAMLCSALPFLVGCGSAGLFLKTPIEDQCKNAGLVGCPELTEGTLAYVDGDKAKAIKLLGKGASMNAPKDLKLFAQAISALGSIPGVSQYMGPVLEVAAILKGETKVAGVDVPSTGGKPGSDGAHTDANALGKITTGKVYPVQAERRYVCAGETEAACVRSKSGPFLVTDVSVARECGDGAILFSTDQGSPALSSARWVIAGSIANGRWFVPDGDMLVIGLLGAPGESIDARRRCTISWSATAP